MKEIEVLESALKAREAAKVIALAKTEQKNQALKEIATHLRQNKENILNANKEDMDALKEDTLESFVDRLILTEARIDDMADSILKIMELEDPTERILEERTLKNGLILQKVSVPIGVIAIIYESRPNVTIDAAGLCLKSGNAAILRGGSESFNSCKEIMKSVEYGLNIAGLPIETIQMVSSSDRKLLEGLITMDKQIDVIIPRGGKGLLTMLKNNSTIPLLLHLDGICHTYIHEDADVKKAIDIAVNAKMRRTGVCNATETILIDESIMITHMLPLVNALTEAGCEIRGGHKAMAMDKRIKKAKLEDWGIEHLDAIVSIKVVNSVDKAIAHIAYYGSHHTDAIITENKDVAEKFLREVDSAVVIHNASTQFCDGGQFEMGAEIGIATGRLHARGPVGLEQLNTYKYKLIGDGHIRPL